MGSSGGRGYDYKQRDIKAAIDNSFSETDRENFETKIADIINNLLLKYNDRDVVEIEKRLEEIKNIISQELEGTVNLKFGGSIEKHTYVDGLSDIDTLVLVNKTEFSPQEIKDHIANELRKALRDVQEITVGNLAVTVKYNDGKELQLLPAIKSGDKYKIQDPKSNTWSEINPQAFTDKLTKINQVTNGKLVPAIKIIKGINEQSPDNRKLTGYHIESIAIEAFKDYSGESTTKKIVTHFFDKAREVIKNPIKDKSGQSIHVDEYLGKKNSEERKRAQYQLEFINSKIQAANNSKSIESWRSLLNDIQG